MSLIYRACEKTAFILNRLPGGGLKGSMSDLLAGNGDIKLPGFMQRKIRTDLLLFEGHSVHIVRNNEGLSGKAVLFLPGGGGMARATRLHYDTARRIALETKAEVHIANYPLAPEYNVRDALVWLERYYEVMLKSFSPSDMVFIGDSAGANLELSLTARLDKEIRPAGLIVISPACGLEYGKPRDIRLQMESYDPLLTVAMNDLIAENWARNVPLTSPDISPEYIDHKDFPALHYFYGSHEIFYPHVKNYLKRLSEQDIRYTEHEEPMCHDWALCSFLPEGRKAIAVICDIIPR